MKYVIITIIKETSMAEDTPSKVKLERHNTERFTPVSHKKKLSKRERRALGPTGFHRAVRQRAICSYIEARDMECISKAPRSVIQYLVLDDRICCQYLSKTGLVMKAGGYFRWYDPLNDIVFISSFKYPAETQLTNKVDVDYICWNVKKINLLYIKQRTAVRIETSSKPDMGTPSRERLLSRLRVGVRSSSESNLARSRDSIC